MEKDLKHLRMAIALARESKHKGNLPFGCILISDDNTIIAQGENTIVTDKDCLGHAEINLIRAASAKYDFEFLNKCTIYTSDEPCPMCTAAIYWSGIGKLVYGLSKSEYYRIVGRENTNFVFEMPCRELLKKGGRKIEVLGPLIQDEVTVLHVNEI